MRTQFRNARTSFTSPMLHLMMGAVLSLAACTTATVPTVTVALTPAAPTASEPAALATPLADSPAAGICGSFEEEVVEVRVNVDVPDPRCVKVRADQRLTVFNRTPEPIDLVLGQFSVRIAAGEDYTIDRPFGEYLAPGVHRVTADPYSGPELWLGSQ